MEICLKSSAYLNDFEQNQLSVTYNKSALS